MNPELWVPAVTTIAIVAIVAGSSYRLIKMWLQRSGGLSIPEADLQEIRDGVGQLRQAVDAADPFFGVRRVDVAVAVADLLHQLRRRVADHLGDRIGRPLVSVPLLTSTTATSSFLFTCLAIGIILSVARNVEKEAMEAKGKEEAAA